MNRLALSLSCMLSIALFALATATRADDKTTSAPASSPRFEALKALAGDWVEVGKDGKPGDQVVSSFRVTANGSVVEETLFPGTPKEMVTMYHRDGADLVLTHYCTLGNQPRMRAEPSDKTDRFVFRFAGATNLKSDDDLHMHEATLTLQGADRFRAEWAASQAGTACHKVGFDLVRKSK